MPAIPVTAAGAVIEARAADLDRRVVRGEHLAAAFRLAVTMVDLTTLEGKDTPEKVRGLCRKARFPWEGRDVDPPIGPVAAVCVYPALVADVAQCLAGSGIGIASVATAFPSGQSPLDLRLQEVERAIADGATEIDMVINRGAWLSGRRDVVRDEVRETLLRCRAGHAHLKIILETGELETYDAVRHASDLVIDAAASVAAEHNSSAESSRTSKPLHDGEVFIKTSTGKVSPAATLPVVLVMMHA
ncbi:MAG: 2-deoxyribose-5-phosphate aldolase, partial [Planctomycetota bacterium]